MTDVELQPRVAAEYLALADVLDSLSLAAWDTPSLCDGWRVREVAAHMTMPARYDEDAFMAELRNAHLGTPLPSNHEPVLPRLTAAYEALANPA